MTSNAVKNIRRYHVSIRNERNHYLALLMNQHVKAKKFDTDPFLGYKIDLVAVMMSIIKYIIGSKLSSQQFFNRNGCME